MKTCIAIPFLTIMPLLASDKSPAPRLSQSEAVITVGGQVRRPGPVPFHAKLTIYAAIQAAGGPTEFGSMRRVKVLHDGKATVRDLTKDEAKSTLIQQDDTIEVPQKTIFGR